jgi:LssY C-terminus
MRKKRFISQGMCLVVVLLLSQPLLVGGSKLELPSGTELNIRLKTPVSSNHSKANDHVEGVVVAPVEVGNQVLIPAGTIVYGSIKNAVTPKTAQERALLLLEFNELQVPNDKKIKLQTQLTEVDNARERVDEKGQIIGILQSETISSRLDDALNKLKDQYQQLAQILGGAKREVLKETQADIDYPAGVEMTLKLTKKVSWDGKPSLLKDPVKEDSANRELVELVNSIPFRTETEKTSAPSDITNLMLLGSREQLEAAFAEAGWATAEALNAKSGLETFRAIAEGRGYKEAPVSVLLLDGHKPDLVFQKQNNTFAKRHHLRIWQRTETFQGQAVWVSAATHDIGIEFSPEKRTFIHKIDSEIDRERNKVGNDLLFTKKGRSLGLVGRSSVPKDASNATGDKLLTDGKMLVLAY